MRLAALLVMSLAPFCGLALMLWKGAKFGSGSTAGAG
jgi:hypothetical protein